MTPERHALVRDIFLDVIATPPPERGGLIEHRCGGDVELRRDVEQLVAHHAAATEHVGGVPIPVVRSGNKTGDSEAITTSAAGTALRGVSEPDALAAGSIIGGRYRMVARLGKGGMGVVYRAEDLTLGQPVALKFLDPLFARDPSWLARFRNEVRTARAVTHPNVCRVFDIGESDGRVFLSMEYVDGEDLTSLFRRIGRLPPDKAIDVARQLCIGLAAAHAVGVLHRDLKPANVMLDGQGRVRITDFGLALSLDSGPRTDPRAGTPAYMAPEQFAGEELSVRSDLYSLGLVLYELFAGRAPFDADSAAAFAELHRSAAAPLLSEHVPDIDPDVDRIVAACLRKHPHDRPASALAVAAAMPGTHPLAAALAANITPSPEMVAAAPPVDGRTVSPKLLAITAVILLAGFVVAREYGQMPWKLATTKPPAVLADRARQIIAATAVAPSDAPSAYGFCDWRAARAPLAGVEGWRPDEATRGVEESSLVFWYRQQPTALYPRDVENVVFGSARVTPADPPLPGGSVCVVLDLTGRLLLFMSRASVATGEAPVTTDENPAQRRDVLYSFTGLEAGSDARVRFEASDGRPLLFVVEGGQPGDAERRRSADLNRRTRQASTGYRLLLMGMTLVAILPAWHNYRAGRCDRRGAWRLAVAVGAVAFVVWLLRARHTWDVNAEILCAGAGALRALGTAALVALLYVALEPYARRLWPPGLIAWTRALGGRFADPVVGAHVLIGVCVGCFWAFIGAADRAFVSAVGWTARDAAPDERIFEKLMGARVALGSYLDAIPTAIVQGLLFLLLLAVLRARLGRPRWAAAITVLVLLPLILPAGAHLATTWLVMGGGGVVVGVWIMGRFGLLTLVVALFITSVLNGSPVTIDFSRWYVDTTLCAWAIVAAIGVYGFLAARRDLRAGAAAPSAV